MLSAASVMSRWVTEELNSALAETIERGERFILPCVIEKCHLPQFLKHRRYADFAAKGYDEACRELLAAIRADA